MKSQLVRLNRLITVVIIPFLIIFTACQPISQETRKAWIDAPLQNSSYPAGSTIHVIAHTYIEGGVAEVLCSIDGIPYVRGAPDSPGNAFSAYNQDLVINEPGGHSIELVAYDAQSNPSNPVSVQINVTAATPAPTATITPAITSTSELTQTPNPMVEITFWSDRSQLNQGECATLFWDIENANAVYLDGNSVATSGSKKVCPSATTTYTLTISASSGNDQIPLTLHVSIPAPSDQEPPIISNISHSPEKIWSFSSCGADSFTVNAKVSDVSDLSKVQVHFRVVNGSEYGSWVTLSMNGSNGNYQTSIDPNDLMQSMSNYKGIVQYYISAEDAKGNSAQSGQQSIEINECLI